MPFWHLVAKSCPCTSKISWHGLSAQRGFASISRRNQQYEWLAILPDKKGAYEQRVKVREKHLAARTVHGASWVLGGATLDDPHTDSSQIPKMNGSVIIGVAESKEEFVNQLKTDIYTTSNVWDWEKAEILPFKSAFRNPM